MAETILPTALFATIEEYFDMMYDADVERFDRVFAPTAQLHGLRDGMLRVLKAADYRDLLASNPSPKSRQAPRHQEILLLDLASPTQALAKVRVRIDTVLYLDYLALHCIDQAWRVTAKFFHIEARFPATE